MAERAHEIDLPAMDVGAPSPVLLWGAITALLYYAPRETSDEVVVLEFIGGLAAKCGPPSDESLMGHRLFGKGLKFYAAHEVEDSEWLRELETKQPHRTSAEWIRSHRQYVFTFHDETVECLAREVLSRTTSLSMDSALAELIRGHQLQTGPNLTWFAMFPKGVMGPSDTLIDAFTQTLSDSR